MKVTVQEAFDQISEVLKEIWKSIEQIEAEIEQLKNPRVEFFKLKQDKDDSVRVKGCYCPKCQKAILLEKAVHKVWSFNCDRCGVHGKVEFGTPPSVMGE